MPDVDMVRLVEQARDYAVFYGENRVNGELVRTLAGLADAVEQLHTWDGLMSLLDEHYPSDVFVGDKPDSDPGARIVALVRELDAARARVADLEAERDEAWRQRNRLMDKVVRLGGRWQRAFRRAADLQAENRRLRLEAGGVTSDGRTVVELEDEVRRLRGQCSDRMVLRDERDYWRAEAVRMRAGIAAHQVGWLDSAGELDGVERELWRSGANVALWSLLGSGKDDSDAR